MDKADNSFDKSVDPSTINHANWAKNQYCFLIYRHSIQYMYNLHLCTSVERSTSHIDLLDLDLLKSVTDQAMRDLLVITFYALS